MSTRRLPIPPEIKLEVRQRCGFGCVICGMPFYQYDHIEDFARTKKHESFNLALLCPRHHAEKSIGMLPRDIVWSARRNPINLQRTMSSGRELFYAGNKCRVIMGNSSFEFTAVGGRTKFTPLVIDELPFMQFQMFEGDLLLTLSMLDEAGREVMAIHRNDLRVSPFTWDYDTIGQRVVLRSGPRQILLDMRFEPPATVRIRRARIMRNGLEFAVMADFNVLVNNGTVLSNVAVNNFRYGIVIGTPPNDGHSAIGIGAVSRERIDRRAAIRNARQQMETARRSFHALHDTAAQFQDLAQATIVKSG